jgi:hypothetical protein
MVCQHLEILLIMADSIPNEILGYLQQNIQFCEWYVEVAWQRLSDDLKSSKLGQHWSRFGNLETPKYQRILVDNAYDDWRGISQVYLTPFKFLGGIKRLLSERSGNPMGLRAQMETLPYRVKFRNARW